MKIGVDLGGTKIEAIALDDRNQELTRQRIPTPRGSYQNILNAISQLIKSVEQQTQTQGHVGIGIPGAISKATGRVKNANTTELIGQPLDQDLMKQLDRPVRVANDANCFTLSESVDGAAAGARVVFGVILGTGCGGGIVVDRQVIPGLNGIAGEWGHNGLPRPTEDELPGPDCYCGRTGCIETFISGTGFARDYARASGHQLPAQQIIGQARQGATAATQALDRLYDRIARSFASVINILDPDCLVIGGGLSNLNELYEEIPRRWERYIFSDRVDTRLLQAQHGDSSGVRGAAFLWNEA
jgi:fructokinase